MTELSTGTIFLYILLLALPILPNLWAIWHVYRHEFTSPQVKMFWILLTVFIPVVGGVAYILFGRRQARDKI